jgi:hypothetical protein
MVSTNTQQDGHDSIPTRPNAPILSSSIATVTVIGCIAHYKRNRGPRAAPDFGCVE